MIKSSIEGETQTAPPITADEAHLANLREAIVVEEKKLETLKEQTANVTDLSEHIAAKHTEFSDITNGIEEAKKDKLAIEKLTETARANRAKAESDLAEAETSLKAKQGELATADSALAQKGAELAQIQRETATANEAGARARAERQAKLDTLETLILQAEAKFSTAQEATKTQEAYTQSKKSEADAATAMKDAALIELEEAKAATAAGKQTAENIVSDAAAEAKTITDAAQEECLAAKVDLERIKAEAEQVTLATAKEIETAKETRQAADDRLAAIETIKQNILIEISKEMKNSELAKGNKVIEDYLQEIKKV